jgi:hypothetical protein
VEAPWPRRKENQIRLAFEEEFDGEATAKARALVETIEKIGVEPFRPPDPLPPIEPEEMRLICWLAIERQNAGERS